jgi:predicted transcriptional regulator
MANKTATRTINIKQSSGIYSILSKPVTMFQKHTVSKKDYNFSEITKLRHLLSNERARMLNVIKTKNPDSIYSLAKILERGFKSVLDDIKLLKEFGLIELKPELKGKRKKLKPVLIVNELNINLSL